MLPSFWSETGQVDKVYVVVLLSGFADTAWPVSSSVAANRLTSMYLDMGPSPCSFRGGGFRESVRRAALVHVQ